MSHDDGTFEDMFPTDGDTLDVDTSNGVLRT
jgi:hypothetical protein